MDYIKKTFKKIKTKLKFLKNTFSERYYSNKRKILALNLFDSKTKLLESDKNSLIKTKSSSIKNKINLSKYKYK